MNINKNRCLIIFLALLVLINMSIFAIASTQVDYSQEGSKVTVNLTGEKNKPVSITIKDDLKYHFVDQGTTNQFGKASFSTSLDVDKTYQCKVNIDGEVVYKDITMKAAVQPDPDPEPGVKSTANIYIKGYKGVVLEKARIEIKPGESALDFTTRLLDQSGINYRVRSGYVSEIDGQAEFDKGPVSGWRFSINGKYPSIGAGVVKIKRGDSIRWLYFSDEESSSVDSSEKGGNIVIKDNEKITKEEKIEAGIRIVKIKSEKNLMI